MQSAAAQRTVHLSTSRILLRPLAPVASSLLNDASLLSTFHQWPFGGGVQSGTAADYVAEVARSGSDGTAAFVVEDISSDERLGLAGLRNIDRRQRRAELGPIWAVIACDDHLCHVVHLLLRFGFDMLDLSRLEVRSDGDRETRRSLDRLGFRLEGTLRAYRIDTHGAPRDIAVWSIIQTEWHNVERLQQAVIGLQDWPWKDRLPSIMPP